MRRGLQPSRRPPAGQSVKPVAPCQSAAMSRLSQPNPRKMAQPHSSRAPPETANTPQETPRATTSKPSLPSLRGQAVRRETTKKTSQETTRTTVTVPARAFGAGTSRARTPGAASARRGVQTPGPASPRRRLLTSGATTARRAPAAATTHGTARGTPSATSVGARGVASTTSVGARSAASATSVGARAAASATSVTSVRARRAAATSARGQARPASARGPPTRRPPGARMAPPARGRGVRWGDATPAQARPPLSPVLSPPPPEPAQPQVPDRGFDDLELIQEEVFAEEQPPWERNLEVGEMLGVVGRKVMPWERGGAFFLEHVRRINETENAEEYEEDFGTIDDLKEVRMRKLPDIPKRVNVQEQESPKRWMDWLEQEVPPWQAENQSSRLGATSRFIPEPGGLSRTYLGPASTRPTPGPSVPRSKPPPPAYTLKWKGDSPEWIRQDRPAPFVPPTPPPMPPFPIMGYTSGEAPFNSVLHILADYFARQTQFAHDKIKNFRRDEMTQFGPQPMADEPEYRTAYREFVAKALIEQEQQMHEESYEQETDQAVKQHHLEQARAAAAKRPPDNPIFEDSLVPPNLRRSRELIKAINGRNCNLREHILQHGNYGDMPPRPPLYDLEFYPGKERAVLTEDAVSNSVRMFLRSILEDMGMLVEQIVASDPITPPRTPQQCQMDMIDLATPPDMKLKTPPRPPPSAYAEELAGLFL